MNTPESNDNLVNERIAFKCARSIEFVEVRRIIRVESSRAYCKLHILNDTPITLSTPLKAIETKLKAFPLFFRSHKSHLINLMFVKSYHSDNGIKLVDNSFVPLTPCLKSSFLEKIEELFAGIK